MNESQISVAITTHNRMADLTVTLNRLKAFQPNIAEVMVCADGCSDGTQAFLRDTHPSVILFENNPGQGSIPSRNNMIRSANSPFVLLLDDDSYPVEAHFFTECQAIMARNPGIGVLTFPQRSDEFPETLEQVDFGPDQLVGTFTSSGSIIRKDLFLKLGGFPDFFFHAYEEPDYSLRVLAAGFKVVQRNQLTVRHHYTTVMRNEGRTHRRHARNEMWSTLMRAPFPLLLALAPYRVFSQGRYAVRRGCSWVLREPSWWIAALRGVGQALRQRQPVPKSQYKAWIRLLSHPQPVNVD